MYYNKNKILTCGDEVCPIDEGVKTLVVPEIEELKGVDDVPKLVEVENGDEVEVLKALDEDV